MEVRKGIPNLFAKQVSYKMDCEIVPHDFRNGLVEQLAGSAGCKPALERACRFKSYLIQISGSHLVAGCWTSDPDARVRFSLTAIIFSDGLVA
jgi:hypothetical protein